MRSKFLMGILLSILLVAFLSCSKEKETEVIKTSDRKVTKRIGMVIGIKPEFIERYKKLHGDDNPGVRDLLTTAHMENFSIFSLTRPFRLIPAVSIKRKSFPSQ